MNASLVRADAVCIPLRDESVDLIITSPPYFGLRSYRDDGEHVVNQIGSEPTPRAFLEALWAVTAECQRVLKPSGSMFVNLGDCYAGSGGHNNGGISKADPKRKAWDDGSIMAATRRNAPDRYVQKTEFARPKSLLGMPWRYAIGCIDGEAGNPLILRAEIVWSKKNGMPESVTDRVRRSHEQWFHMTKEGSYFADLDDIREPYSPGSVERIAYGFLPHGREVETAGRNGVSRSTVEDGGRFYEPNPIGKLPPSVWEIPTEPLIVPDDLPAHFAAFPQEWPRRFILSWSPAGICTVCGEGRHSLTGRPCESCATLIPTQAKSCGECGYVRDWKTERHLAGDSEWAAGASIATDYSTPGAAAPRRNPPHSKSVRYGTGCGCLEPTAPTRPAVVLDPFAGTGTTVGVARVLGRFGVGLDLSNDYLRLARWRIGSSGHFGKSFNRTNGERQGRLL